ncbi:MAG: PTS ascorbate transporter subunit IIC, partial [Tissierellales bacterium]|nr:PTS ascorbate transporter subunit IIC [Tissierellales bacterium]
MNFINFLIDQIFREAPLFLGIIALVGLLLQRKSFSDVLTGTLKTIIGVVILTQGTNILVNSMVPLSDGFNTLYGLTEQTTVTPIGSDQLISQFGSEIGLAMLLGFLINVLFARFIPNKRFKHVFLTGHHLFWFSFIFVAVGVGLGLTGTSLVIFSTIFLGIY